MPFPAVWKIKKKKEKAETVIYFAYTASSHNKSTFEKSCL
jgi:hypothetical protein